VTPLAIVVLLGLQPGTPGDAGIVFTGVNLISMESADVQPRRTVVVRGHRIIAIVPDGEAAIPPGAVHIDGRGRYLLPGLTDAHVHLRDLPWAHSREDFGDAPLYLANGVTTVVNLGGDARELTWRRRVAAGELLGPTIYTSGAFINEPRVSTEDAIAREIESQARAGYDLLKFHELDNTTEGLSLGAYRRMIDTARAWHLPLVGHLPVNLGVDEWLRAGQAAAHAGLLANIYFRPMSTFLPAVGISLASALLLTLIAIVVRTRSVVFASIAAWLLALAISTVIPQAPFFDSLLMKVVAAAIALSFLVLAGRLRHVAAAAAAAVFAAIIVTYWLPLLWRSTDGGITRFAKRVHEAGISIQSTLVVYELFGTSTRAALLRDEAIEYLLPPTRDQWRALPASADPVARVGDFNRKVLGALHREGVPILAGTDAMGIALVPPGTSMHRELALLVASGLSPYEALRAATVNPARFLDKESEFGTITAGKRADLLLVEANPLENLETLKAPIGVMVRGKWLTAADLRRLLDALLQP
jgi:cytosine/adenosine deaminase-related metal-dependent hydrolase